MHAFLDLSFKVSLESALEAAQAKLTQVTVVLVGLTQLKEAVESQGSTGPKHGHSKHQQALLKQLNYGAHS